MTRRPPRMRGVGVALALVALTGLSSLVMLSRDAVPFGSDQAISILMALDIRDNGKHPVFYWGVQYAGTFESHLLSLFFRVVPDSVSTYRAFLFALLAMTNLLVWRATSRALGPRAGLFAGIFLALGPSFLFFKGLTSDGAYTSLNLCLAAGLFAVSETSIPSTHASRLTALAAILGGSFGVAWWIHPLSIVLLPVVVASLFYLPGRRLLCLVPLAVLTGTFLAGSAPWWIKNLRTGFLSLRIRELRPAAATDGAAKLMSLAADGIPMLLGGRPPWSQEATTFSGIALSTGLLAFVLLAPLAARKGRMRPAARPFLIACVLLALGAPLLSLSMARTDYQHDVRYLLPAYLGLAPLAGFALDSAFRDRPRVVLPLLVGALVVLGPGSQLTSTRFEGYQTGRLEQTRALGRDLLARGIDGVYTNYWFGYRFHYLSRGKPCASPFENGRDGTVRSLEMLYAVDRAHRSAFVLEPDDAEVLARHIEAGGGRCTRWRVPSLGLEVVADVPPGAFAILVERP